MTVATHETMLLHPLPANANSRLLVYAMRRMAQSGLNDAFAANAMLALFGARSRRPLLLLRAMMAEMARSSHNQLIVAPCCCRMMTADEKEMMIIITSARDRPRFTHGRISSLLGVDHALGVLSSAQALAQAFGDLGRPLGYSAEAEAEPAFPMD